MIYLKAKLAANAIIELFYPKVCVACAQHLSRQEETICTVCILRFPYTNFHLFEQNPLFKKFWGRLNLQTIDSLLYLEKGSRTEKLLYHLKYNQRPDVGSRLAELVIQKYTSNDVDTHFDLIITVPLHPLKLKKRGYNQCSSFAKKLSSSWGIPLRESYLIRTQNNVTQTGKSRINRWENVENIFKFEPEYDYSDKHILLIDDVLTTGATLEACALAIQRKANVKLSILTMACKV